MKALVLYDTKFGNTKRIAEIVADEIAGQCVPLSDCTRDSLTGVDLVVVGSPIHGWRPSEATLAFLAGLEPSALHNMYVAAFDTGYRSRFAGNAAAKMLKALRKVGGILLIPTQKFVVEGAEGPLAPDEPMRARQWAQQLKAAYAGATDAVKVSVG